MSAEPPAVETSLSHPISTVSSMDQLALLLVLFFAIAIGFVALYLLLRRASASHAAHNSEQAIAAAVSAALAERGATADAVGREREATVATAVARAVEVADAKLNARMREGTEQLDARMLSLIHILTLPTNREV